MKLPKCSLCRKELQPTDIRSQLKYADGSVKLWCTKCFACSVCGAELTKGSRFSSVPMGVGAVTLCETHLKSFGSYRGKTLEELPDELLDAQLKRLTYPRSIDEKHANELLRSTLKTSTGDKIGEALSILSGSNSSANWYELKRMNESAAVNNAHQILKNSMASLDLKIAEVKAVIKDRKQPKVQSQQPQKSPSEDPITVLKLRFAKGEISKDQYQEALKLLT